MSEPSGPRPSPPRWGGWATWLLVVAAAVPVVVVVVLSWRVLTGGFDQQFFADYTYDETGAAAAVLTVAVVQFVGRPVGLLPGRLGRWTTVGIGVLTALVSWGTLLVAVVAVARLEEDPERWYTPGSPLSDLGFQASLLLVAGAIATVAALALARPGPVAAKPPAAPASDTDDDPVADEPEPAPDLPERTPPLPRPVDTSLYERPRS